MPCLVREDRRSRARVEGSVSGREWTIERLEALRATIAAAREFVKRADECVPAYGDRFRPEELDDYYCALHQAIDAEDAAWDGCGVHRYESSSANSSTSRCAVCRCTRVECERKHAPAFVEDR